MKSERVGGHIQVLWGSKNIQVWKSSVIEIIQITRALLEPRVFLRQFGFLYKSVLVRTLSSHPYLQARAPQLHGGQVDAAGSLSFPAAVG